MPRDMEYELKFRIPPAAATSVLEHPALHGAGAPKVRRLVSTYFDTPDALLQANGFTCRIRDDGARTIHTVKQVSGSSVTRGEWECESDARAPDARLLRHTPLGDLLDDMSALEPRFTVEVERTTVVATFRKAEIEIAIDRGQIGAGGQVSQISEVELELKEGRSADLWRLARTLVADLPMMLSLSSKSSRGYDLLDGRADRPIRKISPLLARDVTVGQAFETIADACLHAFLVNIALVADRNVDAVHRARVALRHYRSACQLFGPQLRRKRRARIDKHLKRLSRQLGVARDLDVFQIDVVDPLAKQHAVPGARALARLMDADRLHAHEALAAALQSRETRIAALDLLAFAANGVRRSRRMRKGRPVLRRLLNARLARLARSAVDVQFMPPAAMHRVRKAAKMLRYDFEVLRQMRRVGTGQRVKSIQRELATLQDRLGAIHDDQAMRSHLANRVLRRFAKAPRSATDDERKAVAAAVHLCFGPADRSDDLAIAVRAARRLRRLR